jgi:Leucine-rich repeat (LRR) protein
VFISINYFLKYLKIVDLSNNQIEILDGIHFRLLNNLITLLLQNNPLKQINSFEYLLSLTRLEFINLTSFNSDMIIKKPLTVNQWINLAYKWKYSNKSLTIRTNAIPLQSIFPSKSDQFRLIALDLMKIIFQTLSNSTFTTLVSTPKCTCIDLRNYQRVFFFINDDDENLLPLYQSSTCLMPNGFIHARLFDRRTLDDLDCLILGKKLQNSCSLLDYHSFISLFIFYLFY